MYAQYVETVRLLFRDAEGLELEEAFLDLQEAQAELRRAYEDGASEQEACQRLLKLVPEW